MVHAGSLDNWVRLNIGGKIFETTKQTLRKEPDSFFARLFDSNLQPSVKDDSGAYMIDRSPEHVDIHPQLPPQWLPLLNEAAFYGLTSLASYLEKESKKTKRKELVIVRYHPGWEETVIAVPTMGPEYDVFKALKNDRHFPELQPLFNDPCYYTPGGSFVAIRCHVETVVTSLGFRLEKEDHSQVTYARYVYE